MSGAGDDTPHPHVTPDREGTDISASINTNSAAAQGTSHTATGHSAFQPNLDTQSAPGATAIPGSVVPSNGHESSGSPRDLSAGASSQSPEPVGVTGGFVRPSDLLRRPRGESRPMPPLSAVDQEQLEGLRAIRAFLKVRTSYDVLPLSFRLIVFDTALLVKKSLDVLINNGIVSAPLWDSKTSTFAGLLTTNDYINVIQYYWQNPDAVAEVEKFQLNSLRDIERAIGAPPIETVSIHPERPLYEACIKMFKSRARRIPLVDIDDETQRAMVVSVVTQYRILKFIAINVNETAKLKKPLRDMSVGTYSNLASASMDTPVMDVIHMLVKKNISSVPILDSDGTVINVFESVDVISLIKGSDYDSLSLSVGEALLRRSDDFPGIYTCTLNDRLDSIFETIRKSRVHRLVVIDEQSKLKGVLTLSDIVEYVLLEGENPNEI